MFTQGIGSFLFSEELQRWKQSSRHIRHFLFELDEVINGLKKGQVRKKSFRVYIITVREIEFYHRNPRPQARLSSSCRMTGELPRIEISSAIIEMSVGETKFGEGDTPVYAPKIK